MNAHLAIWMAQAITTAMAPAPSAEPRANIVFVEPLGNGLFYSVNYERLIRPNWGFRGGASFFTYAVSKSAQSGNLTLLTFPLVANYYVGSGSHKFQVGLGATVIYFAASSDSTGTKFEGTAAGLGAAATGVVGYRYLPDSGRLTLGAGFTPILRFGKSFLPWGGLNVGYLF